jgi:hypothetical protein
LSLTNPGSLVHAYCEPGDAGVVCLERMTVAEALESFDGAVGGTYDHGFPRCRSTLFPYEEDNEIVVEQVRTKAV